MLLYLLNATETHGLRQMRSLGDHLADRLGTGVVCLAVVALISPILNCYIVFSLIYSDRCRCNNSEVYHDRHALSRNY